MKILFEERDLTSGKYLPVGRYPVRIVKAEVNASKSSGGQTLYIDLVGLGPVEGKEGREIISLAPQVRWRLVNLCRAIGYSEEYLKSGRFSTDQLVGKVFELEKVESGSRVVNGEEKKNYASTYHPAEGNEDQTAADATGDSDIPF